MTIEQFIPTDQKQWVYFIIAAIIWLVVLYWIGKWALSLLSKRLRASCRAKRLAERECLDVLRAGNDCDLDGEYGKAKQTIKRPEYNSQDGTYDSKIRWEYKIKSNGRRSV